MDEGTGNEGNHGNVEFIETHNQNDIHDTDDESLYENGCYRSSHLIYLTKKISVNSTMDETTIVLLVVAMFVCVVLIAGGGYYYTTTLEKEEEDEEERKTGSCDGMDVNAIFEYNENGECVLKKCKDGFTLQGGRCVKIEEDDVFVASYSAGPAPALVEAPPPPQDCVIGGYTRGDCLSIDTGEKLSGISGSCGIGVRTLTARDITPAKYGGKCENTTKTEECEVPCPKECKATDDNYTPDGACMSQGKELGEKYCGSGVQSMKLDPTTVTGFDTTDLRDAWIGVNWEPCQTIKSQPCEVECVPGKVRIDCPKLDDSIQKSYVVDNFNKPVCFKTDYAQSVLESGGILNKSPENILQPVTADEMWDSEKFEYKPTPTGKQIAYRSGGGMSYDEMINSGCVNIQLEDCTAEEIPRQCEVSYDEEIEGCTPITKCGQTSYKTIADVIIRPEFGTGSCSGVNTAHRQIACETEAACCDVNNNNHWTTAGTTCVKSTGKRALISTNCSNLGQNAPTKSQNCKVNCEMNDWGAWSDCSKTCGGGTTTRSRTVKVQARNGGNSCPTTSESASCNTQPCPVNCVGTWSESNYGAEYCDTTDNERKQRKKKVFTVTTAAAHGGTECPTSPVFETVNVGRQCGGGYGSGRWGGQ